MQGKTRSKNTPDITLLLQAKLICNCTTVAENPCQTLLLQTPAKRPRSQNRPLLTADFDHL